MPPMRRLKLPAGVRPFQLNWPYIIVIAAYHAIGAAGLHARLFQLERPHRRDPGTHLCGLFGINLCYHRLLTHRGLKCPKWLEHAMVVIAMSCLQETPARWVAIHRRHHQFADEQPDPHSPLASFFWSHIGWILVHQPELARLGIYERYAKDILRDRFYVALERHGWLVWINLGPDAAVLRRRIRRGWLVGRNAGGRGADRTWHHDVRRLRPHRAGLAHHLGGEFGDPSVGLPQLRDRRGQPQQLVVGLISNGEGWHNNHHADPRSARHGHRWWEIDNTWLTIRFLAWLGLATDVVAPRAHRVKRSLTSSATSVPAE